MMRVCSLFSGSSGNSVFVENDDTKILIDAGLSAKRIIEALCSINVDPMELSAVLISHEHSDHTKGAGIISRKLNVPLFANEETWVSMESDLGKINPENRMLFDLKNDFEIGSIKIKAFPIPHDAANPVGFNLFSDDKKVTIATDIGHITKTLLGCFDMSDMILLESNHDVDMLKIGRYPWPLKKRILSEKGHLSNEMAGKVIEYMACRGTRKFLLGHLSQENNFPELAYQTVYNVLCDNPETHSTEIMLDIAHRDRVGNVIEV